ncbi:hypothetical protein EB796_009497 [Bugula neritina]|uniref:Caspase family p20 domain-containing protein n=1 Tax=Bugula neritina TaxID=10212 RepID=A0A7J7K2P6_BUGNE|nr:hypothetical protein EB796_009497 [Bugula neritina]
MTRDTDWPELLCIQNSNQDTVLHHAVCQNYTEATELILSSVPSAELNTLLNVQNTHGNTPLHCAVCRGQSDTVKHILSLVPVDELFNLISMQNKDGDTTVHQAVRKYNNMQTTNPLIGCLSAANYVKLLLIQNSHGDTIAHVAANYRKMPQNNYLPDARKLSEFWKTLTTVAPGDMLQISGKQNHQGKTFLHHAAEAGDAEIFKYVMSLTQKADLCSTYSLQDQEGNTFIHCATSLGHTDIVKCLVDSVPSADLWKLLRIPNQQDQTTLQQAILSNNMETLQCLVAAVEATDLYTLLLTQDIYGDTAVHSAVNGGHVDALKSLLDKLSPKQCQEILNIKNLKQFTPLIVAKSNKQYKAANCIGEYKRKAENYFEGSSRMSANLRDSLKYLNERNRDVDIIQLPVKPCTLQSVAEKFYSDNVYRMSAPVRGRCLIINNRYFDRPATPAPGQVQLEHRDGSEIDVMNILNVFQQLSFDCELKTNLSSKQMLADIWKETQHPDYKDILYFMIL